MYVYIYCIYRFFLSPLLNMLEESQLRKVVLKLSLIMVVKKNLMSFSLSGNGKNIFVGSSLGLFAESPGM